MRDSPFLPCLRTFLLSAAAIILIAANPRPAISQQNPPTITASAKKSPAASQAANPDVQYAPFAAEFAHVTNARKAYRLGFAAANAKQDGRAGAAFTRALALRHHFPEALRERELVSERLKQWRAAIIDLTRMIDENPKRNHYFYFRRSLAYFNCGDYAKATADNVKSEAGNGDTEGWGPTFSAKYVVPKMPSFPDSLKDKTIDATVTILVVFGWNGHLRTILKKSAGPGLTALDDLSLKTCSSMTFTPGQENGLPVDDPHLFNYIYNNPPRSRQ